MTGQCRTGMCQNIAAPDASRVAQKPAAGEAGAGRGCASVRCCAVSAPERAVRILLPPAPLAYAVRYASPDYGLCWEEAGAEEEAQAMARDILREYAESCGEVGVYMRLPLHL